MPAIRDGYDKLTVERNEPRFSMGSGPVERRMASPEQLADIAAERAREERAAAAQEAPVQVLDAPPALNTHGKPAKRSPEVRERMRQAQLARYERQRAQRTPPLEEAAVQQPEPTSITTIHSEAPEALVPATDESPAQASGLADAGLATPPDPIDPAARMRVAMKVAEERAELAGDDGIRVELRQLRRRVAQHLAERTCAA